MLFIALILNAVPLGRPVIDHVDVIEINMFYNPRLKLVFHDKKAGILRVVFCKTYIATLTAFDPEEVDRRRRGQFRRRKLQSIQEVSR